MVGVRIETRHGSSRRRGGDEIVHKALIEHRRATEQVESELRWEVSSIHVRLEDWCKLIKRIPTLAASLVAAAAAAAAAASPFRLAYD